LRTVHPTGSTNAATPESCETFPLVESFCKQFDLLVEDMQEETLEEVNVGRLVDSSKCHDYATRGNSANSACGR